MSDHHMEDVDDQAPILSAGGYVDDDIDLDDDNDEDEDIPLVSRRKGTPSKRPKPPLHPSSRSKPVIEPSSHLPPPLPTDYRLRAAGTGGKRDFIIAKFIDRPPSFSTDTYARLYREKEETKNGRMKALEADAKQAAYNQTYTGKRKLERYKQLGTDYVPDRMRKAMKLTVSSHDTAQKFASLRKKQIANEKVRVETERITRENGSAAALAAEKESNDAARKEEADAMNELQKKIDSFSGVFDGKVRNSKYVIMVLQKDSRVIDVVPVGEYSRFSFRADSFLEPDDVKDKKSKAETKLQRFHDRYEVASVRRSMQNHDTAKVMDRIGATGWGLQRKLGGKQEVEVKGEDMDFEMDFADDDVAQIDREFIQKPQGKIIHDPNKNRKKLLELIKDEPKKEPVPIIGSPRSDSDEDQPNSRAPSPGPSLGQNSGIPSPISSSRPPSNVVSPSRAPASTPPSSVRRGTSPSSQGSPRRSRGGTPRADIAHLLPQPGETPTENHVVAVLRVLLQGRPRMLFREVIRYFDGSTPEKKSHVASLFRRVAIVSAEVVNGKKKYFVQLRAAHLQQNAGAAS